MYIHIYIYIYTCIYDTEAEVKQDSFTKEELNEAISRLKNNKTPGPNGVTSELIKLLDEEARGKLLELLNKCWEEEEVFEEMNQADLAVIYKKGPTEKPENYRPIALLNIEHKTHGKHNTENIIRSHG